MLEIQYRDPLFGFLRSIVFQLPIGPQSYAVKRVMRQSIEPTLGGLVAEEQGLLWREISIEGTFGLSAREGFDTSSDPEGPVAGALSGPAWTKRLIRNFIERYGELKADPQTASSTVMIWHDMKMEDHWVIVPQTMDVTRSTSRRMQYPYMLQATAIGNAASLRLVKPHALSLLDRIRNGIDRVKRALAKVNAALQEGSKILGEVRYFAATIDSVLTDVQIAASSMSALLAGVGDTLSVGATFLNSTTSALQSMLDALETAAGIPDDVRQNYMQAVDALDLVASTPSVLGTSYTARATEVTLIEQGFGKESQDDLDAAEAKGAPSSVWGMASGVPSSANDQIAAGNTGGDREFPNFKGFREYVVRAGDTLASIAASELGDGALWYLLSVVNGLRSPYVSIAGLPDTVAPGESISIPTLAQQPDTGVTSNASGTEPGADVLGTDVMLVHSSAATGPGERRLTWGIDQRTGKDLATVSGVTNLGQALQMRTWVVVGTRPLLPEYGLPALVGQPGTTTRDALLKLAVQRNIEADPRVSRLARLRLIREADDVLIEADIVPIGIGQLQAVSLEP